MHLLHFLTYWGLINFFNFSSDTLPKVIQIISRCSVYTVFNMGPQGKVTRSPFNMGSQAKVQRSKITRSWRNCRPRYTNMSTYKKCLQHRQRLIRTVWSCYILLEVTFLQFLKKCLKSDINFKKMILKS
jgi:hypothetical protein